MSSVLLTVYIPTFNRGRRLEKSLSSLFDEIVNYGLERKIKVLVGDNASPDGTPRVCDDGMEKAERCGIQFEYFRNGNNLGFSGNVAAGIMKVSSDWLMFLSDDDNLFTGALMKVCNDLERNQPSVSLYNFSQTPYNLHNPLISQEVLSLENSDYSLLAPLIAWPKLTGVVLKVKPMSQTRQEIAEICAFASHFPHVVISLFLYRALPRLHLSNTFLAEPDEDFLEHVNFVPYIDHYLVRELEIYRRLYEPNNLSLNSLITQMKLTNILEASADALIGFYRGKNRLTKSVKKKMYSNLFRFLRGKKDTSDGLVFPRPSVKFFIKCLALPAFFVARAYLSRFKGKSPLLMEEGF